MTMGTSTAIAFYPLMADARQRIYEWGFDYNTERPHMA